ncbi:hypothetical protein KW794_02805 [Candidatus Saccharibacteria bacterium]|nr:hypothetical protein [Candidatus Saccharibacteria bacterium]
MSELQHQLNVETIAHGTKFSELAELIVDSCFKDSDLYKANLDKARQDGENLDPIVQKLGLWRARAPYQHILNLIDINTIGFSPEAENFDLPIEPNVQAVIEAIGRTMLEEAFESLGVDAPKKVEEFRQAQNWQERLKVCKWLDQRIEQINEAAPVMNEEVFYHPIRLSPKAVGTYPDIKCQPTCLGYSILESAFFEKAGAHYMHAGIAATAADEARRAQNTMLNQIAGVAIEAETELPPDIVYRFIEAVMTNIDAVESHRGFHAGLIVNLGEGVWFQMDPNYDKNLLYHPKASEKMSQAYQYLQELKDKARGIEFMLVNRAGMYPHFFNDDVLNAMGDIMMFPEEAEEFLLDLEPETALAQINAEFFNRLYNPATKDNELMVQDLIIEYCKQYGKDYHEYMHTAIVDAVEEYVFPDSDDGDIRECIKRCKTDRSYLQRRAMDLHFLPFLTLLKLQTDLVQGIISNELGSPHAVTEVGLPAYRIGACVLSDFAVYCGDELPLSFWMAHWPSQISYADHSQNARSEAQQQLRSQVSNTVDSGKLRYLTIDSIIKSNLEQGGVDGDTQGTTRSSDWGVGDQPDQRDADATGEQAHHEA